MTSGQRKVGIIGCGLIGRKRAQAIGNDRLVACFDIEPAAAKALAEDYSAEHSLSLKSFFARDLDVVVVATLHRDLAPLACAALERGAHVLVEKPAGIGTAAIDEIQNAAAKTGRRVKVGFNHRFHPGIARAVEAARSGSYGRILYLRGRYGHGGRLGYEREWRCDPELSGGGEIVDQGMHLLDISYWLLGPLPLSHALLRTQFWDATVDDNAVLVLGEPGSIGSRAPFSLLHVSWTDWKNTFSLEIACERAKFAVDGLVRSYGPQILRIYEMQADLGPPDTEEVRYPDRDRSWELEWLHFTDVIDRGGELLGDLSSARYAWKCIQMAQAGA